MRLGALCCEVSLSHWIALARLRINSLVPVSLCRRTGLLLPFMRRQGMVVEVTKHWWWFLLHVVFLISPGASCVLGTGDLLVQTPRSVLSDCVLQSWELFFSTNELGDIGIQHMNKWRGRNYRNCNKTYLFDRELQVSKWNANTRELFWHTSVFIEWNQHSRFQRLSLFSCEKKAAGTGRCQWLYS